MIALWASFSPELRGDAKRVRAGAIHLVDEGNPRNLVAPHLPVDRDRLRLHARHRAQHQDRAVEHAQRPFDLDREVNVSGRVDQVDLVLGAGRRRPLAVGRRGLDGDALLTLQIHRVHLRADGVLALHFVNGVDLPGVEKDALAERGLARVDVRGDPDVAGDVDVRDSGCHGWFCPSLGVARTLSRRNPRKMRRAHYPGSGVIGKRPTFNLGK